MADTKYLKCSCARCGGHIEFPAEGIGMTTACPHCGWQTELALEAPPTVDVRLSRSRKWLIAGVAILSVGLLSALGAVFLAQKLAKKARMQPIAPRSNVRVTNVSPGTAFPARTKRAITVSNFSVSEIKIEKSSGSSVVYAAGTLKNEMDQQRFEVTVEIDLFDSAERKIGTAKDYKDIIEPRGQWAFRALIVQKNAVSARIGAIREQP